MRKKIIIKNKFGIRVRMDRRDIMRYLYAPYADDFPDYSDTFRGIMERYKDTPLTRHVITSSEQAKIDEDPSYAEYIPKWEVRGYDAAVGDKYEGKARDEFYRRFQRGDYEICNFINDTNTEYVASIKYIK